MGGLQLNEDKSGWERRRVQNILYVSLTTVLWIGANGVLALGVITAGFFVLSGAAMHNFMLHLHNLASRYVTAGQARQESFIELTLVAVVLVFACVSLMRLPMFVRRLQRDETRRLGRRV